jgi:alkanesulfonate monooxygenase SsuD/methylene tetrahydromethanopterin reductase-like flavin-dependent oxidoreductase (luciferase family)
MFGCALADRAARTVEVVTTLRQAWTGEPFQFRGRTVRVQPVPAQPGGPKIALGGSSPRAARRAAHIADGFMPTDGSLWNVYREEACALGRSDPGPFIGGDTSAFHLSRDPERGWHEYAPYALHEANAYAVWLTAGGDESGQLYQATVDADALRASGQYRVLTPGDMLDELVNTNEAGVAIFHPMVGGLPPDQAWESLRLFEHEVLPKLTSSRRSLRGG